MSNIEGLFRSKKVHLLVDPDRWTESEVSSLVSALPPSIASVIIGGTFVHSGSVDRLTLICKDAGVTVGNFLSSGASDNLISDMADFLLIPILLVAPSLRFVTQHIVDATPKLRRLRIPTICAVYLSLSRPDVTSAHFFTQAIPLPRGRPEIIETLSHAASFLGLSAIYLDAGSGAVNEASQDEISAAASAGLPVIVGGGIRDAATCTKALESGATAVVIGTLIENDHCLPAWTRATMSAI